MFRINSKFWCIGHVSLYSSFATVMQTKFIVFWLELTRLWAVSLFTVQNGVISWRCLLCVGDIVMKVLVKAFMWMTGLGRNTSVFDQSFSCIFVSVILNIYKIIFIMWVWEAKSCPVGLWKISFMGLVLGQKLETHQGSSR